MSEFIYRSEATDTLFEALFEFDKKNLSIEPDCVGNLGNKYISKGKLLKITRPILNGLGLRITRTTETVNDKEYLVHELRHIKSKQFIRSYHFYNDMLRPLDNKSIQALGGVRTYVSRYEICDMLYIDDFGDDPDGDIKATQNVPQKKIDQQSGCITPEESTDLYKVLVKYPEIAEIVKNEFDFKHTLYLKAELYDSVKKRIKELVTSK